MSEYLETAKNLVPFIPLAKPIIETIFKPKLDSLEKWLKKTKIDNEVYNYHLYESRFENYLLRTIEKCSIVNTLIFPNQQINIESIYQPLTLIDNNLKIIDKIKIDTFPKNLFEKYQRILISDSAGMGKSTLSRFICLHAIKENRGIPVFIELRKIDSKNTIMKEFFKQINSIDEIFDIDFIVRLLKTGEFIIVFDGFDEIITDVKEIVTQDIRNFVSNSSENFFLLTSRPEGALATFGDFKVTNIQGLSQPEAYQLFEKYDGICNSKLSVNLINEINSVNNQVTEFLVNPFLVSLLYKTYSFKRDIPSRKSTFYNDVYCSLYQDHDLSKDSYKRDKASKLDIQDFRLVLREFANLTVKKGEVEYEKPKASQYIKECKEKLPFLNFKESLYIQDLLTTVPIFTTEGNNIKWAHKSLQDYFAAEFITFHPKKELIINSLIEKDVQKYANIIDLIIELDPNLIRQYVLPNILRDLISHFDLTHQFSNSNQRELNIRKLITFDTKFWINKVKIHEKDEVQEENEKGIIKDEFTRVRNYINDKYGIIASCTSITGDNLVVACTISNRAYFIQQLGIKGLLGKSIFNSNVIIGLPDSKLFDENPIQMSYTDQNAYYNQTESFAKYTGLMLSPYSISITNQSDYIFVPDITYCKKLLATIEKEIENTKKDYLGEY